MTGRKDRPHMTEDTSGGYWPYAENGPAGGRLGSPPTPRKAANPMTDTPGPLDAAERRDGLDALAAVEAMTRFDVAAYELCEPATAAACRTQRDMLVATLADVLVASQGGAQVVIDAVRRNLLAADDDDDLDPEQEAAIADVDPSTRAAVEDVWTHEKRVLRGEDDK